MAEPHDTGASRIDAARADLIPPVSSPPTPPPQVLQIFRQSLPRNSRIPRHHPARGKNHKLPHLHLHPRESRHAAAAGGSFHLLGRARFRTGAARADGALDALAGHPVFTVPYGTAASARDVSVSIANYHPHTFIRQRTRRTRSPRLAPSTSLTVDLLRDGEKVASQVMETGTGLFLEVRFGGIHEEPGQFEYTFRVSPVANEKELSNNPAATYLNVISERIRIFEIEGRPFWDSTFLRRSFARNDKFDIDSLVAFTGDRVRPIRSNPDRAGPI